MRKIWLLCLASLACGGDDAPHLELDDRRFVLQSGREAVEGTTPTLLFDEGNVDYFGGCNASGGAFRVERGALVVDELAGDVAGCNEPRHQQDAFFGAFLLADPKISLEGATLTLTGSDATLVFVED
jgi:heat shock protein HslJ